MTEDELREIEERAEKATWPSTPGFSLDRLGAVVCDVRRLTSALREEKAERMKLEGENLRLQSEAAHAP